MDQKIQVTLSVWFAGVILDLLHRSDPMSIYIKDDLQKLVEQVKAEVAKQAAEEQKK